MTKPVMWNLFLPIIFLTDKDIPSDTTTYTSKCGRFSIEQKHYASSRGCFNSVAYGVTDTQTGETWSEDTLAGAKLWAYQTVDPDYEG